MNCVRSRYLGMSVDRDAITAMIEIMTAKRGGRVMTTDKTRTLQCELCGATFEVSKATSRAKYCPECRCCLAGVKRAEEQKRKAGKEHRLSRLSRLAAKAKEYGISYGQFVALRASGTLIGLTPGKTEHYRNPHRQAWQDELMAIAGRGRGR